MATELQLDTLDTVTEWLKGEHDYQFAKNETTHQAHPGNSRSYILDYELPNKWARFQAFHNQFRFDIDPEFTGDKKIILDSRLVMQVGQSVLKLAAAARGAFIWDAVGRGMNMESAADLSWRNFTKYQKLIGKNILSIPNVEYIEPPYTIEGAINKITGKEDAYNQHSNALMLTTAGLAVTALVELRSSKHVKMVFPEPGVTSGHVEPWINRPQKTAS